MVDLLNYGKFPIWEKDVVTLESYGWHVANLAYLIEAEFHVDNSEILAEVMEIKDRRRKLNENAVNSDLVRVVDIVCSDWRGYDGRLGFQFIRKNFLDIRKPKDH